MIRKINLADQLISAVETGLKVAFKVPTSHSRKNPAATTSELELEASEMKLSAALMRVNHAGEVCAQALYESQALFARNPALKQELRKAADEEYDHLAWCEQRIEELGSHTSYLNPLWYVGSFAIGSVSSLLGDSINLGFLAETEKQVGEHLESHLQRLPEHDFKTKAIILQMKEDESEHEHLANQLGATELPTPIRWSMRLLSKVMTSSAYYI